MILNNLSLVDHTIRAKLAIALTSGENADFHLSLRSFTPCVCLPDATSSCITHLHRVILFSRYVYPSPAAAWLRQLMLIGRDPAGGLIFRQRHFHKLYSSASRQLLDASGPSAASWLLTIRRWPNADIEVVNGKNAFA